MEDQYIVDLYWKRSEDAISQTDAKYGPYLLKIANNILFDLEDSREAVNDTYFRAWCTMPENRPAVLSTYLSRIIRGIAIDIWRSRHSQKRAVSEYAVSLDELEECIPTDETTEEIVDAHLLADAVKAFLRTLPQKERSAFVGRYYFSDPIKTIAAYLDTSVPNVKHLLYKTRKELKEWLKKEGFVC